MFGKTQKECISNLQKAIELYKDAELTEDSRITLSEWLERWLNTYVVFRVRESTLQNYRYQTRLICGILGNKPLHSITTADVQKMYTKLKVSGRTRTNQLKGSELSNTVVRSVHMMLHQAMDVAVREHLIPKNPTNGTTIPKKEAQSMQVLNEAELERFKKVIEQDELWYEFFYTEITTGLRRGEICGLKWQDFNTETNRLHVQRAVTVKKSGGFNIGDTKTTNSDRYILLPPKTAEMLKKRKEKALGEWIFPNHLSPDLPIHPTTVYNHMKTLLKKAELPLIRFHDLQHTFATMALENGMDVKTLSAMIGHVSSETTLNIYSHVTDTMRAQAAVKIDRKIGGTDAPMPEAKEEPRQTQTSDVDEKFEPWKAKVRKSGTGCVYQINDHLWEGSYFPRLPDGSRKKFNVYAKTREECEKELAKMIEQKKKEIAKLKKKAKTA